GARDTSALFAGFPELAEFPFLKFLGARFERQGAFWKALVMRALSCPKARSLKCATSSRKPASLRLYSCFACPQQSVCADKPTSSGNGQRCPRPCLSTPCTLQRCTTEKFWLFPALEMWPAT